LDHQQEGYHRFFFFARFLFFAGNLPQKVTQYRLLTCNVSPPPPFFPPLAFSPPSLNDFSLQLSPTFVASPWAALHPHCSSIAPFEWVFRVRSPPLARRFPPPYPLSMKIVRRERFFSFLQHPISFLLERCCVQRGSSPATILASLFSFPRRHFPGFRFTSVPPFNVLLRRFCFLRPPAGFWVFGFFCFFESLTWSRPFMITFTFSAE